MKLEESKFYSQVRGALDGFNECRNFAGYEITSIVGEDYDVTNFGIESVESIYDFVERENNIGFWGKLKDGRFFCFYQDYTDVTFDWAKIVIGMSKEEVARFGLTEELREMFGIELEN